MVMATTWAYPFVVCCAYTCGRRGGILIQRLGRDVVVSIMHQAAHKEKLIISSPICLVLFPRKKLLCAFSTCVRK
jgi:hypothetical protein